MNYKEIFASLKGRSVIIKLGKTKEDFLKDAQIGDEITFTLDLKTSMYAKSPSEITICCVNTRTNNFSHLTINQLNKYILCDEFEPGKPYQFEMKPID